jgi:predicted dehydrogenase
LGLSLLASCALLAAGLSRGAEPVRLITLDPGHFHAALLQKEMLPGVAERAHVFAPLGPDLLAHLGRILQFNSRADHPTRWQIEVHTGPDFLEQMLRERPGNVVVLSGRNRPKIEYLRASVLAGLHVLADKPWIIEAAHLPELEAVLETAEQRGVVAHDAMTQRFEITCLLQRALVKSPEVFGTLLLGSREEPAVHLESVHYLIKEVAGLPSLRPAWFFDIRQQGDGLSDVGTHLVDLVQWILFPDQAVDYRRDVEVQAARRWPTPLTQAQFQRVTGERGFPDYLQGELRDGALPYLANNTVHYTLRRIHVRLDVKWAFEAAPGQKDTELAVFRGSRSRVEIRQDKEEDYIPEVYVVPNEAGQKADLRAALQREVETLAKSYPGLSLRDEANRFRIVIPSSLRVGHEAHFSLLVAEFLRYVAQPKTVPAWEKPNLLAKYFVTTRGAELARRQSPRTAVDSKKP